jgi:hypothetical protein
MTYRKALNFLTAYATDHHIVEIFSMRTMDM